MGLLARLGVLGWERIEPLVLAALATESPVLLIGAHGTAKTLLLNRVAEALGLEHRHYNASLINFDDLVGYPFPDESRTKLRYVPTPASIWDAESVFLDEISRCRVDQANRLFSIIHEKRVQGMDLTRLRFRWAAMNPPECDDDDAAAGSVRGGGSGQDAGFSYIGSEPLDPALADRFPFVIQVPDIGELPESARRAVIAGGDERMDPDVGEDLLSALRDISRAASVLDESMGSAVVGYVDALLPLLARIGLGLSGRRARYLAKNVLAVHAARRMACAPSRHDPADSAWSAWLALTASLPHPAQGVRVDPTKLQAAHKQAWAVAALPADDPWKLILAEQDPVRRVAIGLKFDLDFERLSTLTLDAHAGLEPWERHVFAAALFPVAGATGRLNAVATEALAATVLAMQDPRERHWELRPGSAGHTRWQEASQVMARLDGKNPLERAAHNLLVVLLDGEDDFPPHLVLGRLHELTVLFGWEARA